MTHSIGIVRKSLRIGVSSAALLVGISSPAFAQDAQPSSQTGATQNPNTPQTPGTVAIQDQRTGSQTPVNAQDEAQGGDVVVTGSLFRRTDTETPSPVTVLTADTLNQRGINTVTEAIQRLSANGAGTLPNSFSANGAFASGASAPSLRGLTTDSTLVLFDGLRAAYYPLADDGTRNFVDINQIPDAIVDRIEVLKDGASSTYGADAVAGVVNIITKKQITGIHLNGSGGISERGDSAEQRLDATVGYGDLSENRFNVYVSGEYQRNAALYSRDRGFPYNTSDLSSLCAPSVGTSTITAGTRTCRTNSVVNGIQYDGTVSALGSTMYAVVRPYNATNTTAVVGSRYQLLNAATGCGVDTAFTLSATQAASTAGAALPLTNCQQDNRELYSVITPRQSRIGGSGRLTVQLGEKTQAYIAGNFYQSDVYYTGTPVAVRATTPAGGVTFSTASIALPIYVCNRNGANATLVNSVATVAGCNATNGTLNPNNPFAAQGEVARIYYSFGDIPVSNERLSRSYRGAGGINGSFGSGFDYRVEGTYNKDTLDATYKGYEYFQNVVNAIADGSYNFVNPSLNSQAVRDYIAPTVRNRSTSELYQINATLSKELFNLPGGPLGVAAGVSYRHEEVLAPSANPVVAGDTTGIQRYVTINGFGTSGSRNVRSAFFEINAPLLNQLELNGSGRYDDYSSGQSNFSPKIGGKFTPIKQVAFRSTFSKGFRIPSFAESYGLPTTGYITQTVPAAYQASAACTIPGTTSKYSYCTTQYSLGLTSVGNPNLKPERSTNFTGGVIIEPVRNFSLSVDYYNIYKKDLITGADYAPQIASYYANAAAANTALTTGVTGITQDALYVAGQGPYPLLTFIQYGFINANSAKSTGVDFDFEGSFHITPGIKFTTSLDATYVIELSQTINGVKQSYVDSLGPYQTTSASGTPQWRGSWQNTLSFGAASLTATAYYTAGYSEGSADDGNTPDGQTCTASGSYTLYRDGVTIVRCRVNEFIDLDMTANVKVNDQFSLYFNVLNVLGAHAPYDPSTYGAYQYNPAWANAGVIGRYFRAGFRANF